MAVGHQVAIAQPREPITVPVLWIKAALGVILAPLCVITALAFFDTFTAAAFDGGLWKAAELWFFALGGVLYLISFLALPRPLTAYVLGHELTHGFFIILCGGKIRDFQFDHRGGFVVTGRNNTLISLSPYFVPFYTIVVMLVFALLTPFIDVTRLYTGVFYGFVSFKWALAPLRPRRVHLGIPPHFHHLDDRQRSARTCARTASSFPSSSFSLSTFSSWPAGSSSPRPRHR